MSEHDEDGEFTLEQEIGYTLSTALAKVGKRVVERTIGKKHKTAAKYLGKLIDVHHESYLESLDIHLDLRAVSSNLKDQKRLQEPAKVEVSKEENGDGIHVR